MKLQDEITIELRDDKDLSGSREHVLEAAQAIGFDERDAWCIVSAVFEACANAVHHGCEEHGSYVHLHIRTYDGRFEAVVKDFGDGFVCPAATPVPPPTSHRGRGLPLMKIFMDEVKFDSDGGCKVTLTKFLPNADGTRI